MSNPYPWIKDSQHLSPSVTGYLAVTAPLGLYLTNGTLSTTITPTSVTSTTFNGALSGNASTATNITGGLGGQILYQSAADTTAKSATGTTGQFLQSNGSSAPSWVNQNTDATPSELPTSLTSTTTATLSINFNSSFSSVTRYRVSFTTSGSSPTITVNTYTLSNPSVGGQYTIVIELFASGGTATWVFNGTGLAARQKSNFTGITTGAMTTGNTRYVVLTFAYDGTNYFMSGSTFD